VRSQVFDIKTVNSSTFLIFSFIVCLIFYYVFFFLLVLSVRFYIMNESVNYNCLLIFLIRNAATSTLIVYMLKIAYITICQCVLAPVDVAH